MDSLDYRMCHPNTETQLPEGFKIQMTRWHEVPNKMYIGGITSEISKQALIEYLSKFGTITDFIIKTYPESDVPRDFGFVLFKDDSTVEKVLQVEKHVVCGKEIDLQRAKVMEPKYSKRKVFVFGLSPQFPGERILEYFGMYGKIESLQLPVCKTKNERHPFCFITYTDESSVHKVLRHRFHYIGLEQCEVSLTRPKRFPKPQQQAESNVPSLGVAGCNREANPQKVAESNAPSFGVAGCNTDPNPQQLAERNAPSFGVAGCNTEPNPQQVAESNAPSLGEAGYNREPNPQKLAESNAPSLGVAGCNREANPQKVAESNAPPFGVAGCNTEPNPQQVAESNAPSFGVAGCNTEPNPQQLAESNAPSFGVADCNTEPNPQQLAESNAPSFGVESCNKEPNPQVAESNAPSFGVAVCNTEPNPQKVAESNAPSFGVESCNKEPNPQVAESNAPSFGVESCNREPNPQVAESNGPSFGVSGCNRGPNPQQLAESNAPSFEMAGCNRGPNPEMAESNAAIFWVAKPYGDGEFLGNPNAFFVNQNEYGAVGGGQGFPVAPVPEPFVPYNPQFAFPGGAYVDFYNGYTNQPVFNSYSGQYFLGYDYYNYATGAHCNEQTNQAVAFQPDGHGLYQFF